MTNQIAEEKKAGEEREFISYISRNQLSPFIQNIGANINKDNSIQENSMFRTERENDRNLMQRRRYLIVICIFINND